MAYKGVGSCSAWVNFNMENQIVRGSYNVSSVSDQGVGKYYINFSTAMGNSNYCVVPGCSQEDGYLVGPVPVKYYGGQGSQNSGGVTVFAQQNGNALQDAEYYYVAVFGTI